MQSHSLVEDPIHGGVISPQDGTISNEFLLAIPLIVIIVGLVIERVTTEIKIRR